MVNMDSFMLTKIIGRIYANKYDQIHSVLIYKDGMLVFEEYMQGNKYLYEGPYHYGERIRWDKDSLHVTMSCTKSVVSACIGIAVDKGFIKDVNESIFNYLPEHRHYKKGGKGDITIEHLLTMSSGLEFDEWSTTHGSSVNDIDRIHWECQDDPVACVLDRSMKHQPGEKFNYNSGGTIVLGEILRNASGWDLEAFADQYLFIPLGIDSATWLRFENGVIACGGGLRLTSRDMLKIGICFLNSGVWNDQQIISQEWVELSKTDYKNNKGINVPGSDLKKQGYSYSWWTGRLQSSIGMVDYYAASGWGGQKILVIDELDMVVVFTGGNYVVKNHHREIMERFILPAIYQ
jgi:CubicO group peptidase (beta-lactamase class C family)